MSNSFTYAINFIKKLDDPGRQKDPVIKKRRGED